MERSVHRSVMPVETLDLLAVKAGGVYLDATLGGAGHAAEILKHLRGSGSLLALDRDRQALVRAEAFLRPLGGNCTLLHGNHAELEELVKASGFSDFDGILIDTGVSSDQLDDTARGFSFMRDAPLDMRMDQSQGETAAALLARLSETEMGEIIRHYGEEPQARRLARAIVKAREKGPLQTTGALVAVAEATLGTARGGRRHPATRLFQALRMVVNGELEALGAALEASLRHLRPNGRLVVITFESLSDRLVKQFFTAHTGRMVALQQGGERWEGELPAVALLTRRALKADTAEVESNRRARSARLRAIRRLTAAEEDALKDENMSSNFLAKGLR